MAGRLRFSFNTTEPALLYPDAFSIVCFNDDFRLALDLPTIRALLLVCKRTRLLLGSKVARFCAWFLREGFRDPDGQLQIGLTASEKIALSLRWNDQTAAYQSWVVAQVNRGSAAATFLLAQTLQSDIDKRLVTDRVKRRGVRRRITKYLTKATNGNSAIAQLRLAKFYRDGIGLSQDHTKAAELYLNLAKRGCAAAQVGLGRCYENGEGVVQDFTKAIEWYINAADQGSEDGRLHVVFLRGWFSLIGYGLEQSDVGALNDWQEVSAKSSDSVLKPIATHMVGWMYYLGRGIQQDQQRGIKIIRENRSDDFRFGEGECLAGYRCVKSMFPAATKIYQLCQLGSERDWLCKHLMAVFLAIGFGTVRGMQRATSIFEQLVNEGHSDSQHWLGRCWFYGWGVSRELPKAIEWCSKSAEQGNSYGKWGVARCYYWQNDVAEDLTKTVEWCRLSVEQDNRYGQFLLGSCYQKGDGVAKDIDAAVFWLRKAADQGFERAIESLKELGKWP
ncbi:uncharacterized protein BJ171DRAFT_538013 [Polychytrium aggregatum]|uniref:uncharacterized protein n=1 Tax=Polychytrium aggregatum TaxID=110093 RepID=UPI0022FEF5B3|nr:uncharacterized protein BJ171DRAFT_538013 [Polychytrium aggregatum]KAI9192913.1 hypothetical protein BJ171DRAFT_538013 [Polychytrium aggregatum]